MSSIAIANIVDDKNKSIGIRVLHLDTNENRDIQNRELKKALKFNQYSIDNIELQDGKIVGTNGSLDRLTKVCNNNIVGEQTIVIVYNTGRGKYLVANYQGNLAYVTEKDLIKFGKQGSIANGTVVDNNGTEYLRAIKGSFKLPKVKGANGKYVGETIYDIPTLLPIYLGYDVIDKSLSKKSVNLDVKENFSFDNIVNRKGILEFRGYTIGNGFTIRLKTKGLENRNIPLLNYILSLDEFHKDMTRSINSYKKENNMPITNNNGLVPDNVKRVNGKAYYQMIANMHIYKSRNKIVKITQEQRKDLLDKLNIMDTDILLCFHCDDTKIALNRHIQMDGIYYDIIDIQKNSYIKKRVRLEDIYRDREEYSNVTLDGNTLLIRDLNRVVAYDIREIDRVYGRMEVESSRNTKAKLLNKEYYESVSRQGELAKFISEEEHIIVPRNTKYILQGAILVHKNNKSIEFGDSIEKCSTHIFDKKDRINFYTSQMDTIIIKCNEKASLGIIDSIKAFRYELANDLTVKFNRKPTEIEMEKLKNIIDIKVESE